MKTAAVLGLTCTLATILAVWACIFVHPGKDEPDPKFLARDLYFLIGDLVISAPVVAVRDVRTPPKNLNPLPRYRTHAILWGKSRSFANGEYKAAILRFAGDPNEPANVSGIKFSLGVYGTYGEYTVSREICPLLAKEWSKKACKNLLRKERGNLPISFHLATYTGMAMFKRHSFSISPTPSQVEMVCSDSKPSFCKAALRVSDHVYAVWSPSCIRRTNGGDECDHVAEGAAITKFIQNDICVK